MAFFLPFQELKLGKQHHSPYDITLSGFFFMYVGKVAIHICQSNSLSSIFPYLTTHQENWHITLLMSSLLMFFLFFFMYTGKVAIHICQSNLLSSIFPYLTTHPENWHSSVHSHSTFECHFKYIIHTAHTLKYEVASTPLMAHSLANKSTHSE